MLDEQMDDMIREAAAKHGSSYMDTAWKKMEGLLDKHLPRKKDSREVGLFILFFLLIGTGSFFAWFYFFAKDNKANGSVTGNTLVQNSITAACHLSKLTKV